MRNARPFILIAISLLIGLVAVVTAAQFVNSRSNVATTKVVVANRTLEPGTKVDASMLEVASFPAATRLKDSFDKTATIEGRVVVERVVQGEPVLGAKLAKPGEQAGLAAVLAPGRRAITVKVNDVSSVAGFTLPGSYVDLVVNTMDENQKPMSKIVLERVLVLAVAQQTSPGEKSKLPAAGTVTLEVSPEQAEQVDLARNIGHLAFALRNRSDTEPVATSGARRADLLRTASMASTNGGTNGGTAAKPEPKKIVAVKRAPVAKAPPPHDHFEIIRGVKKSSTEIDLASENNPT